MPCCLCVPQPEKYRKLSKYQMEIKRIQRTLEDCWGTFDEHLFIKNEAAIVRIIFSNLTEENIGFNIFKIC